ncbi:hypothetical protein DesLBE_3960 [Desulfitobacterium sp. LBE]|uniref:Plasmid segregation centromere-binding protein ParR n=2 Tax=root TaxID=1 RepID=A0A644W9P1_9ZZZZ|nr:hypothetical protein DesLBE_3960 [Desulfitobacterium sp. LBE]
MHREAEALLAGQASRRRTEFVVTCILAASQKEGLEQTIRQAVRDELRHIKLPLSNRLTEETDRDVQLSDLPGSLIHALEEL